MRKILFMTDWYSPGFRGGGPIRSLQNLVDQLYNSFQIFILTKDTDFRSEIPYSNIDSDVRIDRGNYEITYLSKKNLTFGVLKRDIEELSPDFIYLNSMYSLNFTITPLIIHRFFKNSYKVILASRGMLQEGALRNKNLKKKLFLFLTKKIGLYKNIRFHATDLQEKLDIIKIFGPNTDIHICANIVKSPMKGYPVRKSVILKKFCYISLITIKKNLLFILDILRNIENKFILDIYGTIKDSNYWNECQDIIQKSLSDKVFYKGELQNDLVPGKLLEYHFFLLPTLGENFGHAIYEALSNGIPVIIGDRTPWKGLEKDKAGWDISLDNPGKFKDIIKKCIEMNETEYKQWSKGARQYAVRYAEENNSIDPYLKLFS